MNKVLLVLCIGFVFGSSLTLAGYVDYSEIFNRRAHIATLLASEGACPVVGAENRVIQELSHDLESVDSRYLGLRHLDVSIISDDKLLSLINDTDGLKLEVGASNSPQCRGNNCIFVDVLESSLLETRRVVGGASNAQFFHNDVADMHAIQTHSVKRIVSQNFPWGSSTRTQAQRVIQEMKRVISKDGVIIISSNGYTSNLKADIEKWFHEPIEAAKELGLEVDYLATPTFNGIVLRPLAEDDSEFKG